MEIDLDLILSKVDRLLDSGEEVKYGAQIGGLTGYIGYELQNIRVYLKSYSKPYYGVIVKGVDCKIQNQERVELLYNKLKDIFEKDIERLRKERDLENMNLVLDYLKNNTTFALE